MASEIASFVNEGLGHSSYLVDLGDGTALMIDPARIPTAQVADAAERGLRIAYTADTHTHADYISGSPDLAARGATFLAPAAAGLDREYHGLADGDIVEVGCYTLEAIATPGFEFPDLDFRFTGSATLATTSPEFTWLNSTIAILEGTVNMGTGTIKVEARAA